MLVALAVAGVIALAALLSLPIPTVAFGFDTNSEITSRVSPGLAALLVALASGAAGAFATMRADISNSLPGVAIAISLVPPLCVTGMSLAQGRGRRLGLAAAVHHQLRRHPAGRRPCLNAGWPRAACDLGHAHAHRGGHS